MSKIESRCGLLCSECSFRESHNCGGCVETNGNPFHGECPVAKCCQDKGFMHCGECHDIPAPCGESDCKKKDENGFTTCDTCDKTTCGKLHAYSYTDPDHGDNPPGARVEQCKKWAKENDSMIIKLSCVNITSKDPKALADFYRTIGVPVFVENECYDGFNIGNPENSGTVCVWNENTWGKSTAGYITMVFNAGDLQKTCEEIKKKGVEIDPPRTADWGGQELILTDPDGNKIMILLAK